MVLKIHNGKLSLAENFFRPEDSNFEYLYWAEPACDFVIGRFHCIIERMIILSLWYYLLSVLLWTLFIVVGNILFVGGIAQSV